MRGGIRRWVSQVVKPKPAEVDAKFLRVGAGAYLHGESVLALLGLADVNPRKDFGPNNIAQCNEPKSASIQRKWGSSTPLCGLVGARRVGALPG